MPKITFLPMNRSVYVKKGINLLNIARKNRIPVRTRCNGQASCLMCKVMVLDNQNTASGLSLPSARERRKLGHLLNRGYRLACQTFVWGDAVVTVPEDPLQAVIRAKLAEQQEDEW